MRSQIIYKVNKKRNLLCTIKNTQKKIIYILNKTNKRMVFSKLRVVPSSYLSIVPFLFVHVFFVVFLLSFIFLFKLIVSFFFNFLPFGKRSLPSRFSSGFCTLQLNLFRLLLIKDTMTWFCIFGC